MSPPSLSGMVPGRARGRAEGSALRRGLVWPLQIHICWDTLWVWSEQPLRWWDQRPVAVRGCQHSARLQCPWPLPVLSKQLGGRLDHAPPRVVGSQGHGASTPESRHPE